MKWKIKVMFETTNQTSIYHGITMSNESSNSFPWDLGHWNHDPDEVR